MTLNELLLKELLDLFLYDQAELLDLTILLHQPPRSTEKIPDWFSDLASVGANLMVSNELMRLIVAENLKHRNVEYPEEMLTAELDARFPVPTATYREAVKQSPEQVAPEELRAGANNADSTQK